jgi:DNA-3-methyladenine glycosylase II
LDLTADALRRLASNAVDVVAEDGTYRRVLTDAQGSNLIEVRQRDAGALALNVTGAHPKRWVPVVAAMLGTHVELEDWHPRVQPFPWLVDLTNQLRGMHPPRYPTLWEALAHAIVFQQISIHAASAIMRRTVQTMSAPVGHAGVRYYPFFTPSQILYAPDDALRGAGLSANKVEHLRSAAAAVEDGVLSEEILTPLASEEAAERLRTVRGIGPWSASVVLLRGLGRLDVFPLKDSGVAQSLRALSGDPELDAAALLDALGPVRGLLYFVLLLGRIRNLAPVPADSGLT